MKIKRLELIKLINQRITRIENERDHRYQRAVAKFADAQREYHKTTELAWITFADTIMRKIESNELISNHDIPRQILSGYSGLRLFDSKPPAEPTDSGDTVRLRTLVQVLERTTDEEVSTYSLEKMGFPLGRVLS